MNYRSHTKEEHAPSAPKNLTKKEVFSTQNMLKLSKKLPACRVRSVLQNGIRFAAACRTKVTF